MKSPFPTLPDNPTGEDRPQGGHVFYRLSNPKILAACRLTREVLLEQLERTWELSRTNTSRRERRTPTREQES